MNATELTAVAAIVSPVLVLVGVIVSNNVTARNAKATDTTERDRLASAEIHAALDRAHRDLADREEKRRFAELSAEVAHIRADEADVRASEAEGLASGLAWRLELCEARERGVEAAEALRLLDDLPPVPPD